MFNLFQSYLHTSDCIICFICIYIVYNIWCTLCIYYVYYVFAHLTKSFQFSGVRARSICIYQLLLFMYYYVRWIEYICMLRETHVCPTYFGGLLVCICGYIYSWLKWIIFQCVISATWWLKINFIYIHTFCILIFN